MPARSGRLDEVLETRFEFALGLGRAAVARRAENVKSSTVAYQSHYRTLLREPQWIGREFADCADWRIGPMEKERLAGVDGFTAVVVGLILLDELLHADRVRLPVPVAADRARAACRLDDTRRRTSGWCRCAPTPRAPCASSARAGRTTRACSARRSLARSAPAWETDGCRALKRLARNTSPGANGRPFLQTTNSMTSDDAGPRRADGAHQMRRIRRSHRSRCRTLTLLVGALSRLPLRRCSHAPDVRLRRMPYRQPGAPAAKGRAFGQAHRLLSPAGQPGSPASDRRGVSGVQRRAALEACRIFSDKMLDPEEDTTIGLTIAGAMTPAGHRRLRRGDDGSRAGRLHHQHRREPVSRPASRAEFHAASRLAVRRRRRALRAGHHPHLRRAVSGDRCCSKPTRTSATSWCVEKLEGPITTAELHYRMGRDLMKQLSGMRGALGRRARRARRRAHLHVVAGRQLDRHEPRVSRAAERQLADDRSEPRRQRSVRDHPGRQAERLRDSRRRIAQELLPAGAAHACGRSTAFTRAATTTSSRSRPTRSSGADCLAPRRPRR